MAIKATHHDVAPLTPRGRAILISLWSISLLWFLPLPIVIRFIFGALFLGTSWAAFGAALCLIKIPNSRYNKEREEIRAHYHFLPVLLIVLPIICVIMVYMLH